MSTFVLPIPSKLPFVVNQPSMTGDRSENFFTGGQSLIFDILLPKLLKSKQIVSTNNM